MQQTDVTIIDCSVTDWCIANTQTTVSSNHHLTSTDIGLASDKVKASAAMTETAAMQLEETPPCLSHLPTICVVNMLGN
jgi:hypothetical protein